MVYRLLEQWFPTGDIHCNDTESVVPSWGLFQSTPGWSSPHSHRKEHNQLLLGDVQNKGCEFLGLDQLRCWMTLTPPELNRAFGISLDLSPAHGSTCSWLWWSLFPFSTTRQPSLQPLSVAVGERAYNGSRWSLCFGIFTDKLKNSKVWKIAQKLFFQWALLLAVSLIDVLKQNKQHSACPHHLPKSCFLFLIQLHWKITTESGVFFTKKNHVLVCTITHESFVF